MRELGDRFPRLHVGAHAHPPGPDDPPKGGGEAGLVQARSRQRKVGPCHREVGLGIVEVLRRAGILAHDRLDPLEGRASLLNERLGPLHLGEGLGVVEPGDEVALREFLALAERQFLDHGRNLRDHGDLGLGIQTPDHVEAVGHSAGLDRGGLDRHRRHASRSPSTGSVTRTAAGDRDVGRRDAADSRQAAPDPRGFTARPPRPDMLRR